VPKLPAFGVDAGARREGFYTNLKPGSYVFEVVAAGDHGVWAGVPARARWDPTARTRPRENTRVSVTTAILAEGGFSTGRFTLGSDGTLRMALETLVGVRYRLERSKANKGDGGGRQDVAGALDRCGGRRFFRPQRA